MLLSPSADLPDPPELSLRERSTSDGVEIQVLARAKVPLRELYFRLEYDATDYRPVEAGVSAQALACGELLQVAALDAAEGVELGLALVGDGATLPDEAALATIRFESGPAAAHAISQVPLSNASRAPFSLDLGSGELRWSYANQGDYDQNSEVHAADLARIAAFFRETGPFDVNSALAVIDGDENSEINAADIVPIAGNYGATVRRWNVYSSGSLSDYPTEAGAASPTAPLTSVDFAAGTGESSTQRLQFLLATDLDLGAYYWLRPSDGTSEGVASIPIRAMTGDNSPPTTSLIVPINSGDVPFIATFDASASSDPDGAIVRYEFDPDGDGPSGWQDNGTHASMAHVYYEKGHYYPRVRVTDDRGATAIANSEVFATIPDQNEPPVADLIAAPAVGAAPLSVTFAAGGSTHVDGGLSLYSWDFGDGSPNNQTEQPMTRHVYEEEGAYIATVTVRGGAWGSETDTATVTVQVVPAMTLPPVAVLTAEPRYGPVPLQVNFDASGSFDPGGSAITLYEWDFDGDGSYDATTSEPQVAHEFVVPGVFDSTVRISNSDSETAEKTMLVMPTADDSFPPDDSIFALPSQSKARRGEAVTFEVLCKNTEAMFSGCSIALTFPKQCAVVAGSFDHGSIGRVPLDDPPDALRADGIWPALGYSAVWDLASDYFYPRDYSDPTRLVLETNAGPYHGWERTEIANATGSLINVALVVNSDITLGFRRYRLDDWYHTTYYTPEVFAETFWTHDANNGLPGVELIEQ